MKNHLARGITFGGPTTFGLVVHRSLLKISRWVFRFVEGTLDRVLAPSVTPTCPCGAKRFQHRSRWSVLPPAAFWAQVGHVPIVRCLRTA